VYFFTDDRGIAISVGVVFLILDERLEKGLCG